MLLSIGSRCLWPRILHAIIVLNIIKCPALFAASFLCITPARLFVVKVSCNMEFPTVSATFQIHLKLFPANQLLLKWLEFNDSSKVTWSCISGHSIYQSSLFPYLSNYFGVEWAGNINYNKIIIIYNNITLLLIIIHVFSFMGRIHALETLAKILRWNLSIANFYTSEHVFFCYSL